MPWYRHLLWPFAILYGIGVWIRNRLFDRGVFPQRTFDVPVICVGNLEAGGTGKSPLVMYVASFLFSKNKKVAVLSRGYGRNTKGFLLVEKNMTAEQVGDEPMQLKNRLPEVIVAVCENRVEGIGKLMTEFPDLDVVVMDDGFQHRWVKPGLTMLVTPSTFPFWKNHLLPVGILRESKVEAKRAQALVVSGTKEVNTHSYFNGSVFQIQTIASDPVQIWGDQYEWKLSAQVMLFAGIGNPERFKATAKKKYDVLDEMWFPDHHWYSSNDVQLLQKKINSFGTADAVLLTTEKDAMRLKDLGVLKELGQIRAFYLPIELEFQEGQAENFSKMLLAYVRKDQ